MKIDISREDAMYLKSISGLILGISSEESAQTYISLLAQPFVKNVLKLKLVTNDRSSADIAQQLIDLANNHFACALNSLSGKALAPSFTRQLSSIELEEEANRSESLSTEWQKHGVKEYELFRSGKQVGSVSVLKLEDKNVVDGKRYKWSVYGTDKIGYEKYLYKAQNNVEIHSMFQSE